MRVMRRRSGYGHHLETTRGYSRLEIVVCDDDSVSISVASGVSNPLSQISMTGDDMRDLMSALAQLYRDRDQP